MIIDIIVILKFYLIFYSIDNVGKYFIKEIYNYMCSHLKCEIVYFEFVSIICIFLRRF